MKRIGNSSISRILDYPDKGNKLWCIFFLFIICSFVATIIEWECKCFIALIRSFIVMDKWLNSQAVSHQNNKFIQIFHVFSIFLTSNFCLFVVDNIQVNFNLFIHIFEKKHPVIIVYVVLHHFSYILTNVLLYLQNYSFE